MSVVAVVGAANAIWLFVIEIALIASVYQLLFHMKIFCVCVFFFFLFRFHTSHGKLSN